KMLQDLKPDQIKAVSDIYKAKYGIDLADDLKDKLTDYEYSVISKLLPPAEKAAEAAKDAKPLSAEQQKAAIETASGLAAKMVNPFHKLTMEEVQQALYGKSEAEIKAIKDAFTRVGLDLEDQLRKNMDGAELGTALELARHKDKDVTALPEGVD